MQIQLTLQFRHSVNNENDVKNSPALSLDFMMPYKKLVTNFLSGKWELGWGDLLMEVNVPATGRAGSGTNWAFPGPIYCSGQWQQADCS